MTPLSRLSLGDLFRRRKAEAAAAEAASELASHAAPVMPFRDSLVRFDHEMTRSRRYQTPLTVAAVQPSGGRMFRRLVLAADDGLDPDMLSDGRVPPEMTELAAMLLGPLIRGSLRVTDLVAYDATEHDHVILLTQTGKDDADTPVRRIREIVEDRFPIDLRVGTAEFPGDGLVLDALVDSARGDRPMPGERSVRRSRSNGRGKP